MLRIQSLIRTRLFIASCLLCLTLISMPIFSSNVYAAGSFTTQTRLGAQAGDNWEPAVATDQSGHVYVLYKDIADVSGTLCTSCPKHVVLQISSDRGQTWGAPKAIDPESVVGGQYDPQILVDPLDGKTLWASYLQNGGASTVVVKSTDFGQTWSAPVKVENVKGNTDKDELAVRGLTIAVGFDIKGVDYASISKDGGQTWTTRLVYDGSSQNIWSLSGGAGIDSQGNISFVWSGYTLTHGQPTGHAYLLVTRSSDGGQTWPLTTLDTSGAPYPCSGCGFAFLGASIAMTIASDDTVYVLYSSTVDQTNGAPERIFLRKSTDHGTTYSIRQDVSSAPPGIEHCFPAVTTGSSSADLRIGWMDERTGAWNLFSRNSLDGGSTWSSETQISSYLPGFSYLSSNGFLLPYGDYFQMKVDSMGSTQIAWGEGSATGPGNIWTTHN